MYGQQHPTTTHSDAPRRDRLATITAWICAAGMLAISLLVLDAVGAFRPARPVPISSADLPPQCPPPIAGERLLITIELRAGKLDVACRTVRPAIAMRGAQ